MNCVDPIRDPRLVYDIGIYLKQRSERNYILYQIGVYVGIRVSDIIQLRVRDVANKDRISIREKKTRKTKTFTVNAKLKKEIAQYCKGKKPDDFLIKSRQGYNQPICREMAYKILDEVGKIFGLYNLGIHSLRKTFGYHFYKQYKDVVALQKLFNHSDPSYTLRYIGWEQSELDKMVKGFKIY